MLIRIDAIEPLRAVHGRMAICRRPRVLGNRIIGQEGLAVATLTLASPIMSAVELAFGGTAGHCMAAKGVQLLLWSER